MIDETQDSSSTTVDSYTVQDLIEHTAQGPSSYNLETAWTSILLQKSGDHSRDLYEAEVDYVTSFLRSLKDEARCEEELLELMGDADKREFIYQLTLRFDGERRQALNRSVAIQQAVFGSKRTARYLKWALGYNQLRGDDSPLPDPLATLPEDDPTALRADLIAHILEAKHQGAADCWQTGITDWLLDRFNQEEIAVYQAMLQRGMIAAAPKISALDQSQEWAYSDPNASPHSFRAAGAVVTQLVISTNPVPTEDLAASNGQVQTKPDISMPTPA